MSLYENVRALLHANVGLALTALQSAGFQAEPLEWSNTRSLHLLKRENLRLIMVSRAKEKPVPVVHLALFREVVHGVSYKDIIAALEDIPPYAPPPKASEQTPASSAASRKNPA